jgi:hypothetical protein
MPSVYSSEAFAQRVNYAAACISNWRGIGTRHFDACFEMCDGDAVVVALYRRSLKNPKLAANLWRAICRESTLEAVENLKDLPTYKLAEEARREREEGTRAFGQFMEEQREQTTQPALF